MSARGRLALLGALLLSPIISSAQDPDGTPLPIVDLTSVKATAKGKGWEIDFVGKAPQLPEGTIIEFALFWRVHPLREFEHTLSAKRDFHEKRHFDDLVGFAQEVYLRAKIDFVRQPRAVQEAMEKDPETFPLDRSPWTVKFYPKRFPLGSAQELEKQEESVRGFFRESLKRALALEKAFGSARSAAKDGSRFHKDGAFDSGAWQKAIEKEVRDPLRALQREMAAEKGGLRILAHQRDFGYLTEIVNAVALRTYERSRSLHEELGISPDPADFSPREININCDKSTSAYLETTTKRLCESQKIELSEISG